jgi:SAM-dependent methyltransferase
MTARNQPQPTVTDVWSTGSFEAVSDEYLGLAGELVSAADVRADDDVLDVGCGTGNVAITAARRGATVTGVDVTPSMLETARENAEVAGVDVDWRAGDATDLPFADDSFDVTLSSLGHMYGDPPAAAAAELQRVTRSGGTIAFISWTPTTIHPAMAGVLLTHVPLDALPDYSAPPFMWGDADVVRERLGDGVRSLDCETRTEAIPTLSPGHFWQRTATHSGVFIEALEALPDADRPALREAMDDTIEEHFDPDENAVVLAYLLATATVR